MSQCPELHTPQGFSNYLFLGSDVFMRPQRLLGAPRGPEHWPRSGDFAASLGVTLRRAIVVHLKPGAVHDFFHVQFALA